MAETRIHKAIADAGVASRRAAEALVAAGRVTVNGAVAEVGQRVDPTRDTIVVDGHAIGGEAEHVYVALDKPPGVTSTVSDRHAERTVLDLVPDAIRSEAGRLYPVGRLDRDTEGLILLTNDGDWAQRLLHPRYEVEREYAIGLERPLLVGQARALEEGIVLDEGRALVRGLRPATDAETRKLQPSIVPARDPLAWYRATLRQGWRRQLRRMFAAVDAPVTRLVRVRIGTLRLDGMVPGEVRRLDARAVGQLAALAAAAGANA
jgi:23S rRNA pseudouridine2605 synthase